MYGKLCKAPEIYNLLRETNLITLLEKFDGTRNATKCIYTKYQSYVLMFYIKKERNQFLKALDVLDEKGLHE
jgi:hypothetical protein